MKYQSTFVKEKLAQDTNYSFMHTELETSFASPAIFLEKNHPIFEESMKVLDECQQEYDKVANDYSGLLGKVMLSLKLTSPKRRLERRIANLEYNINVLDGIVSHSDDMIQDMQRHYLQSSHSKIDAGKRMNDYKSVLENITSQQDILTSDYNSSSDEVLKLQIENELFNLTQDSDRVKCEQEESAAEVIFLDNALQSLDRYKHAMVGLVRTARAALGSGRLIKKEVEASIPYVVNGQRTLETIQGIYENIQRLRKDLSTIYTANMRSISELTKYRIDPSTATLIDPEKDAKAKQYSGKIAKNLDRGHENLIDRAHRILERDRNRRRDNE